MIFLQNRIIWEPTPFKGICNLQNNKNMKLKNILGFLYATYLIMSQIMTIVFFVQYCRTDSLLEIVFIDSFLSEIKGLLWIIFIWLWPGNMQKKDSSN